MPLRQLFPTYFANQKKIIGDTEKWKRVKIGWLFKTGMYLLFGTLLGFQIWFWTTGVHDRPATDSDVDESCQQYGFLFSKVQIDNPGFITFNLAISLIMLAVGSWLFFDWIGMFDECKWHRRKKKRRWRWLPLYSFPSPFYFLLFFTFYYQIFRSQLCTTLLTNKYLQNDI